MKKIIMVVASCFLTSTLYASENLVFESKKFTENSQHPKYQITINYPQIKSPATSAEKKFNDIAKKWVINRVDQFKKSLSEWDVKLPIPQTSNGSSLTINYDISNSTPQVIISLRYNADNYFAGSAHPTHEYSSINYDLNKNKMLSLANLFKTNSNFLDQIALISTQKITDKLNSAAGNKVDIFKEGLLPDSKNYNVWNLTPEGIKFTFNEYQVAAYVFGPQEIVIPYKQLHALLASDSSLAKCLSNNRCQIIMQKVAIK